MNLERKINACFKITVVLLVMMLTLTVLPGNTTPQDQKSENEAEEFIAQRKIVLKSLSHLGISASAGFNGHKAGEVDNLYQLSLGVGITKDMYPGEFHFHTGTSLVIQNSVLQENVTTMVMSYDHHLAPWLETYGFIERFSNTFLRLHYRYEIGGGFKGEINLIPDKWRKRGEVRMAAHIIKKYDRHIHALLKQAAQYKNTPREQEINALVHQLEKQKTLENGIEAMARKRSSLLTLSLALSVFSELEKPENVSGIDQDLLKEHQHFRVSIRPGVKLRPSNMITLSGQFYYKLPLFKRSHPDDPLSYRTYTILRAALNLTSGASWTKTASLVFQYKHHFDNNPFGLRNTEYSTNNFVPTLVNDTHDEFLISFNVEF
jgi:hypothetical protein